MASKRASKDVRKVIRKEVKRARLTQSELHRRSFLTNVALKEDGSSILAGPSAGNFMLNATLQGTDSAQRVGNQVKESGLRIKGMLTQSSATAMDCCSCVRVLVVRDHDNKGLPPTLAEVLQFTTQPNMIGSLGLWSNRKRFTFVFDQSFTLQAQASTTAGAMSCTPVDIDLRADAGVSTTLTYSASSDSSDSLLNGGLYCFMWFHNLAAGEPVEANRPAFYGTVSFFFHDV